MGSQGSKQAMDNINTLLGSRAGVLELVFRMLPLRDLKNVLLVCQLWRETAAPLLWARRDLWVTWENITAVVEALGDGRRLGAVSKISTRKVSDNLLEAMARQPELRSVDMINCGLCTNQSWVKPELLARTVIGLQEVKMIHSRISKQQAEAILRAVCAGAPRLKIVTMQSCDLSSLDAELLARGMTNLRKVNICRTELTKQQMEEILTAISTGQSQLQYLDISQNNLSSVEPNILAKAMSSLKEANIRHTQLTNHQTNAVFIALSAAHSQLKNLNVECNNLSLVEPAILARAVTGLENVNMSETQLTDQQMKAICIKMDDNHSHLTNLDIQNNDLSLVEPNIFAKAVNNLQEVKIPFPYLTNQQIKAILTVISAGHSQLKNLDMNFASLSLVEPSLLAGAVTSLEDVEMGGTELTDQQLEAILITICGGASRLKTLNLGSIPLSRVEAGLLARAASCLEEVYLMYTELSQLQAEAILAESLIKTSLRRLNISHCGLNYDFLVAGKRLVERSFIVVIE